MTQGDDEPVEPGADPDAAWQEIVANYGERPPLAEEPTPVDPTHKPIPRPAEDPDRWEPEEHYVPPPPPPAPRPTGPRGAAWIGLFGAPTVMLVCLVLNIQLPGWAGFLLFCAFLGGFGYLVATMRKHDDSDPWDDGAVV